jgi:hypothetical protein
MNSSEFGRQIDCNELPRKQNSPIDRRLDSEAIETDFNVKQCEKQLEQMTSTLDGISIRVNDENAKHETPSLFKLEWCSNVTIDSDLQ